MTTREVIPLKQKLNLSLQLPGSKSITNRAFLCAALAKGKSVIKGALISDDTEVMIRALKILGVRVQQKGDAFIIHGTSGRFKKGNLTLDLHNAGTATRFLTALMALREGVTVITGDQRMQERPIKDLAEALKMLGCKIRYLKKSGCPPLQIQGFKESLNKGQHIIRLKGNVSSQYFSALLLMAPLLKGPVRIEVIGELTSKPYIDVTLNVLKSFGIRVKNNTYRSFEVTPQVYRPSIFQVEGDASAASYFTALRFLHGGKITFENLKSSSSQGDIHFKKMLPLLGKGRIDMNAMPDVAMTLAILAPFKKGLTEITGLSTLRHKETDRLKALETELKKLGVKVRVTHDSICIKGAPDKLNKKIVQPILISTYNDHRMAMCFAVVGTKIPGLKIENPDCTQKTYPAFWGDLEKAYQAPLNLRKKHLVLIGMRGAGKTYLGKKIARALKRPFVDLDDEIRKEAGMSIHDMVARHGWGYFRDIEQKICSIFSLDKHHKKPLVVATGGGVVLDPSNMRALKRHGLCVLIYADPQVLTRRILAHGFDRPPIHHGQNAAEEIEHLWEKRRPLYLKYADLVWDDTSGAFKI